MFPSYVAISSKEYASPALGLSVIYALIMLNNILRIVLTGTLVTTLIGLWVTKSHESQQWLRNEKLRAAEQFLLVIRGISGEMLKMNPNDAVPFDDFLDRVTKSEQGTLELISSRTVIEAAQAIAKSIVAWTTAHDACRTEETVATDKSKAALAARELAFSEFRDLITDFIRIMRSELKTDLKDNPKFRRWLRRK